MIPTLEEEAEFWNAEYELLFGENPGIGFGTPMPTVHAVQSRIIRHYIDEMKKVLTSGKS